MMSAIRRDGICFQYAKSGTCRYGLECKFSHGTSMTGSSFKISQRSKRSIKHPKGNFQEQSRVIDHIDNFFEEYPDFDYESTAPIWTEFNRMCDEFGWDSDDYEMRKARGRFKSAMVQQFNDLYGTDDEDLTLWQKLCHVLSIEPVPQRLKECRERVRQTHVNLVDLVDTLRTGDAVNIFPNLEKLRDYTIKHGKYFPKEDAYAGGLLRFLLREILHSHAGDHRKIRRFR